MEGNLTSVIYNGVDWIVTNSPNTTITILAILGIILAISMVFETANKFVKGLAFLFAIMVYYPYCYIKGRIKK